MSSTAYDTAFVEAREGENNLLFKDEKQQARFELGVSMMIYKWQALETAVQNSWGGPASADKRDWITAIVLDLFKDEKLVDAALIEETLLYAMLDEFDTNVEDESAGPIAVAILDIYKECDALNYSTIEQLYNSWLEKQKNKANEQANIVKVEEDPLNPDVSSCEESDQDEEHASDPDLDVDMDDEASTANQPVIDEDGFELVQKKGRK